jgi:hypothetical protein
MADPIVIPVVWDQQDLSSDFILDLVDQSQAAADATGKEGIPLVDRTVIFARLWQTARGISPPLVGDDSATNSWTRNRSLIVSLDDSGAHVSTQDV